VRDDEDDETYEALAAYIEEIERQVDELCTPEYLADKLAEILLGVSPLGEPHECHPPQSRPQSHMPMRYCAGHAGAVKNARPPRPKIRRTYCESCGKNGYSRYRDALLILLHQTSKVGYPLRIYHCPAGTGLHHLTKK
jgi:hypothetical protein